MVDGGDDVSDPRNVDPTFGGLADFDALIAELHQRGMQLAWPSADPGAWSAR